MSELQAQGNYNLSGADFSYANLSGADLRYAKIKETGFKRNTSLRSADLSKADLSEADLTGVDLNYADLSKANLSKANLSKANLNEANLNETNFSKADLNNASLGETSFNGTNFIGVKLSNANHLDYSDLNKASFSGADFSHADLNNFDLRYADLSDVDFRYADLSDADLTGSDLTGSDLTDSDLSEAKLIKADLSNSNITGVNLYGSARDNWIIDNIECDYFFNDPEKQKRLPSEGNFKKGEFEELYKQLPTFEYIFEKGFTPIDAFIMDQVVQAINEQQPEIELRLDSFQARVKPRAIFTVFHKHDVEETKKQITDKYEKEIKFLEGQYKELKEQSKIKDEQLLKIVLLSKGDLNFTMGDNINFSGNGNIAFGKDKATVNQTNIEH